MIRQDSKLSREEFARRIGHTINKQHSIEYHKKVPKDAYIDHMCEVYCVNREWVMTGQGDKYIDRKKQLIESLDKISNPDNYRLILDMVNSIIDAEGKQK